MLYILYLNAHNYFQADFLIIINCNQGTICAVPGLSHPRLMGNAYGHFQEIWEFRGMALMLLRIKCKNFIV